MTDYKYPFRTERFIEFFGKGHLELLEDWKSLRNNFSNLNAMKSAIFKKYVKIENPKYEDLKKYYMSDEFNLWFIEGTGQCLDRYIFPIKTFLNIEAEGFFKLAVAFFAFSAIGNSNAKIKVLEYGCGSNLKMLSLAELGFDVTFADIPHRYFKFLQKSIHDYFPKVKFVELSSDSSLVEKYDYVSCCDVLEHVIEPEQVLTHIFDHMNSGALIYLSVFMDDMHGEDQSHLIRNTLRYNDPEIWHRKVEKVGLKRMLYAPMSRVLKVWRKK